MIRKFAVDAAANPTRFYKMPHEVVQDRRLTRAEKLAILEAWELEAKELSVASEESMGGGEPNLLQEVVEARIELGDETDPVEEGSVPTRHGVRTAKA